MTGLTIRDLHCATDDPALVARVYAEVLRPSFTLDELSGPAAVEPGEARVLTVALDAGGAPVAAAVTEIEPVISLLGYLAVSPAARGLGAGGRIMAHLAQSWRAAGLPFVLAEVHDPRGHVETEDEHPQARLRFYGRAGATVLDVPWVQPALAGGERVADMLLLALHRAEPVEVPSGALLTWAQEYFVESEGALPSDRQGLGLLARIAARDRIPVLPLELWRQVRPLGLG